MSTLRTREEARAWLFEQGITVKKFAETHGLDVATTYQVLNGTKVGKRGKAHDAAVALGLKPTSKENETPRVQ